MRCSRAGSAAGFAIAVLTATCSSKPPAPAYFRADPATSSTLSGTIHYSGPVPAPKAIDSSEEPSCPAGLSDETVVTRNGALANAFVYITTGLENKQFEPPPTPVAIEQKGCAFHPRVLGIQTGQQLEVLNSDPLTHNIHPLAQVNREWNHSQGQGDAPLARKFLKPEIMIRVKCNIHSWMRAYIGVVEHPYFAVTSTDGTYSIPNVPPGEYTVAVWHESLGTEEQKLSVRPASHPTADFTYKRN